MTRGIWLQEYVLAGGRYRHAFAVTTANRVQRAYLLGCMAPPAWY